jgi:hypothetical protein
MRGNDDSKELIDIIDHQFLDQSEVIVLIQLVGGIIGIAIGLGLSVLMLKFLYRNT